VLFVGSRSVRQYAELLLLYAQMSAQPKDAFRVWMRLVDSVHFLSNFMPRKAALAIFGLCTLLFGWATSRAWRGRRPETAWASIIALSVVLSIHTMSYDSILVVLACLVGLGTIESTIFRSAHNRICALIWCLGWLAWPASSFTGVNLFTPAILALAVILLAAANLPKENLESLEPVKRRGADWSPTARGGVRQVEA
jgi:hypothetical protein